jgi:F-type H+-transporting ATPase subunit b
MTRTLLIIGLSFVILLCGVAAFASSGAEGEPNLNPLTFRTDTAIWTGVVFLCLVTVLTIFAFKPIADALDAREKAVADNIASAEAANHEAKDEVRGILDAARKDAQRNAEGILEKAKEAAHLEAQRAQKEIEAQTDVALQQLAERSATLATNLAGKMIRAEVKPEHHRDLIQTALSEFAKN